MITTAPQTSTKLVDALSAGDLIALNTKMKGSQKLSLRIEVHGGTLHWTTIDSVAVVDECASILDGDIEIIDLKNTPNTASDIKIIAETGVTFNVEII